MDHPESVSDTLDVDKKQALGRNDFIRIQHRVEVSSRREEFETAVFQEGRDSIETLATLGKLIINHLFLIATISSHAILLSYRILVNSLTSPPGMLRWSHDVSKICFFNPLDGQNDRTVP
ncbi:hypothetical protein KM043_012037 [Ampulex compressa]|nr:hypothetical protein KM043_012037 [Ampulex compressa]